MEINNVAVMTGGSPGIVRTAGAACARRGCTVMFLPRNERALKKAATGTLHHLADQPGSCCTCEATAGAFLTGVRERGRG